MQYHFVVIYDEETGNFLVDNETCLAKFGDELVFDSSTNEWYNLDELMEADYTDYASMLETKLDGVY